ncbi:MAG: ABC transporter ATP-binding protein [Angelakisella sp.]|nr:ABC transporter ATP-binding protein [Angelakisella sp.]
MQEQNIIEMHSINKYYQMGEEKLHVLKNISLTVTKGDFVAILGPSGSGKSTLMNVIGCMDVPESGEYLLDGVSIPQCSDARLTAIRNEKIGFVFQKYQLIPKYSVLQNICMPILIRGASRREAEEQCMETIGLLGLNDRLRHKPNELSGGQQQRVAIARALVGHPSILLADEPTGALDSTTGKEVLQLFLKLNQMGNTIIMITHDEKVASYASRTLHIIDGELS